MEKKKIEPNWSIIIINDRKNCPYRYNREKPFPKIDGKCYFWYNPRNCVKKECIFRLKRNVP